MSRARIVMLANWERWPSPRKYRLAYAKRYRRRENKQSGGQALFGREYRLSVQIKTPRVANP